MLLWFRTGRGGIMKHAIVFPGQGWQYPRMGYELYESEKRYKDIIDYANSLLTFDLKEKCFSDSVISDTKYVQPIIFVTCYALYRLFEEKYNLLSLPTFFAGHSLGEYTALTVAGALEFEEALALVEKRGQCMAIECESGKMGAVIGMRKNRIEEICKEVTDSYNYVYISNYNSLYQSVIAGTETAFIEACKKIKNEKGRTKELNVSNAFHTKMMTNAANNFSKALDGCKISLPQVSVISNVTGEVYKNVDEIRELLKEQMTKPVQWVHTMQTMEHNGVTHIFEISPKSVLSPFFKQTISKVMTLQFYGEKTYCIVTKNTEEICNYIRKVLVTNKSNNIQANEYNQNVICFYKELGRKTTDYPVDLLFDRSKKALISKGCCDSKLLNGIRMKIIENIDELREGFT